MIDMIKKIFNVIIIGILFGVLSIPVVGCKSDTKQSLPAPVAMETPIVQTSVQRDYMKDIKADLNSLLDTSKLFVKQGNFAGTFSNIGVVLALNDNPDPQKNTLAKFFRNLLKGLSANADINTLKGLILAISSMDRSALQGNNSVSEGLIQMMERNMYGQLKTTADVKTSSLRSLLFMLKASDVDLTLKILGINTHIPLLYFIDSPDHPEATPGTVSGITKNIASWAIGEIVTAQKWGREGKIKRDNQYVAMDRFQALDWVLYKKSYHFKFAGITLMKFNGMVGLMSNKLVQIFMPSSITDPFPAFVDLAGGMTEAEYHGGKYDGFTSTSWKDRYGTAGRRHKLFALFGPIMEYYWWSPYPDGRLRSGDMVAMLAGLNEIDPSEYKPLTRFGKVNPRATFRQTALGHKTVMQTLEDSGLLTALLKRYSDHEGDMLAPALDMLITVTLALNTKGSVPVDYKKAHPEFKGNTFFDVVFNELNLAGLKKNPDEINRLIEATIATLFKVQKGESKNYVARLADWVNALGKAANDKNYLDAVRADLVKIIQAYQNLIYSEDFERILPGIDNLLALNDSPTPPSNTLARFLTNVLHAAAPLSDGETVKGLLLSLLSVDKSAMETHGISEGIIYMAHHNYYGQKRETADIKSSQLRSFFFLIENFDRQMFLTVNGKNTGIDLISLIDSPDHPPGEPGTVKNQTTNMAEWYIGEMVTAARWGREGKIMLNGRYVHMNQYQAYDWLLFKKRYQLTGIGRIPLNFTGANGIWTNDIVKSFLPPGGKDTVMSLIELAGGMTDAEYAGGSYAGFTANSWKTRYGTGGRRHKVLGLFIPMLEFLWNARDSKGKCRAGEFVRVMKALNEISIANYQPLTKDGMNNSNATLRRDEQFTGKSVMKAVEDNRLLRIISRSHGPNDNGILAPSLDLLIRIIAKLNEKDSAPDYYRKNHPDFQGNTLLDFLFAQMQIKGFRRQQGDSVDPVEKLIHELFMPRSGESQNLVGKVHTQVKIMIQAVALLHGRTGPDQPTKQISKR